MPVDAEYAGNGHKQHLPIWWPLHHRFNADVAVGTGAVVNHERLPEGLAETLCQQSCDQINRSTRRAGGDDLHRPGRPSRLCLRRLHTQCTDRESADQRTQPSHRHMQTTSGMDLKRTARIHGLPRLDCLRNFAFMVAHHPLIERPVDPPPGARNEFTCQRYQGD